MIKAELSSQPAAGDSGRMHSGLSRLARLEAEASRLIGRFDHVTRLPNRLQFLDGFAEMHAATGGDHLLVLVTLADARHYNEMLRALGLGFAEDFVRAGADEVLRFVPRDVAVYHVSVLSFAFVIEHGSAAKIPAIASAIADAFADSVRVNDIPIKTRLGIGLYPITTDTDGSEALRAALTAAQDSRTSPNGIAYYNHKSDAAHMRAFRILTDLPAALAAPDQLSLAFQPRVDLASGRCHGAEALLRWNHPDLGVIPPGEFIPLAEQTAIIGPITDWVLNRAMHESRQLIAIEPRMRISINASPINLAEQGFDDKLLTLCHGYGLEPENLELEFTEGALISDAERTTSQLESLRTAGIEIAIDDFGSGYSNLAYLTGIPADVLKIDQSLIRPVGVPRNSDFLVRQIVGMAKGLGFRVCAEGIETDKTLRLLKSIGCQEGQGYFIARPMPVANLKDWIIDNQAA